ncbi:MAG: hypothetical protein DHS20C16_20380 [Phycisphaerae bacterium]|nr:MAG: hypothetical protein DHS20C16_20380 [Phycisphaerae bacterium]
MRLAPDPKVRSDSPSQVSFAQLKLTLFSTVLVLREEGEQSFLKTDLSDFRCHMMAPRVHIGGVPPVRQNRAGSEPQPKSRF